MDTFVPDALVKVVIGTKEAHPSATAALGFRGIGLGRSWRRKYLAVRRVVRCVTGREITGRKVIDSPGPTGLFFEGWPPSDAPRQKKTIRSNHCP